MKQLITNVTIAGQDGALLTYLSRVLCVGEVLINAGGFTDRSGEARTEGGTAFNLLSGTSDEWYVGSDDKFSAIRVNLAAVGAGCTLSYAYWNGSTWVGFTVDDDGTEALTQSGEITWTIGALTGWAKNAVNGGPSMYHIRITTTTTPSITPTCNFCVVNWTIFDDAAGTNRKVFKTIGEDGASPVYLDVIDNTATHGFGANYAATRLWESWDAALHTGTNGTPTVAQLTQGIAIRKSATADGTARKVHMFVSRDAAVGMFYAETTGLSGGATGWTVQKHNSYVVNDAWGWVIVGCLNQSSGNNQTSFQTASLTLAASSGNYVQRAYTGSGGSTPLARPPQLVASTTGTDWPAYPNGPDGKLILRPVEIAEGGVGGSIRGALTGFLTLQHTTSATLSPGVDTFTDPNTNITYTVELLNNGIGSPQTVAFNWIGLETPHP